ncbi:MAG: hypothetical protein WC959_09540 [Kiritimatiellales bacterium]
MVKLIKILSGVLILVALIFVAGTLFYGTKSIHDILHENKKLQQSLSYLTTEDQIGFAKVIQREVRAGQVFSTIRFVETARDNKLAPVLVREYEIEGDTVYFDALIVTFSDQAVMDGKARALYLWRRVYGESQSPADGFMIEEPGAPPARYDDLLHRLKLSDRQLFWKAIWDLSNDPDALQRYGIKAIYGNAVYKKLQPGLIYVFKISAAGQVYPETVPDL